MANSHTDLDRFKSDSFEPISFRERGATVPFTTPLLLNARIRTATSGRGFEMLVANPSGGRGMLILPWSAMLDICSPTLFDRQLWQGLAKSSDVSPIAVRRAAEHLLAQGLAGRQTAFAAKDSQQREQASQRLTRTMLLESLVAVTETPTEAAGRPQFAEGEAFVKRAERALARAATIAGISLAGLTADLEELVGALSGATPQIEGEESRLRHMLSDLQRITNEITDWARDQDKEAPHVMAATFVEATARQTLECGQIAFANSDALIADLGLLLPKWKAEKENIVERARGPDWVLDGWKTPMALWQRANPSQRRAAIWEMALIAPVLPREAKAWLGAVSDWRDTPRRITQVVREKSDWISGNAIELVARNENLIGLAIAYENRISPLSAQKDKITVARMQGEAEKPAPRMGTGKTPANSRKAPNSAKPVSRIAAGKSGTFSETRALGGMIETASDKALSKIVSVVDKIGNPELHERLLGPSLRRLKRLRPTRPASLMRVLFMPLSGALIDPLHWRRAEGLIPRSALEPLLNSLSQELAPQFDAISLQLRSGSLEDEKLIDQVGRHLWQLAGNVVPRLRHGASWSKVGFGQSDFSAITALAEALWRHAGPLWNGMQQVTGVCQPAALRASLIGPANEGNLVFAAALNTLMQRAAHPASFVTLLKDLPTQSVPVVEDVLNKWVSATLPELMEEDFASSARLAQQIGIVISALEELPRLTAKADAKQIVSHRRNLDQFCRTSYREVVSIHVIQALLELLPDDTESLEQIEQMARIARSLEDTGRRFGSPKIYEDLQDDFRAQMEKRQKEDGGVNITAMEMARIEEIMLGQEAAERFLYRRRS
jgi:hypothetical protein